MRQLIARQILIGKPFSVLRDQKSQVDVRAWIENVPVEREARSQVLKMSQMGDVIKHPIAAMPDLHFGQGATVGAVLPMTKAIIPAAVGVDIGCGMLGVKTTLKQEDLPNTLSALRLAIEVAIPHGRTHNGRVEADAGGWRGQFPSRISSLWKGTLEQRFQKICSKRPEIAMSNNINHLGTLGTGNHFIEVSVDTEGAVWIVLHSGSRGVGNKIGMTFIELAKKDMEKVISHLPDADLAYLTEGTQHFAEYVEAVEWAQDYARINRELMMNGVLSALRGTPGIPPFSQSTTVINCHHNYVEKYHVAASASEVWLIRKGATSARKGEMALIPGSMGALSYVVRGKGNEDSYCSCSHGAGRQYSRGESTRRFTLEDHERATLGVECRKDKYVLDETPLAYKPIEDVMNAQKDLVEIVTSLKQVLCVKG